MIEFSKVKMKNFLSIGKNPVELDLNKHNITLVTGENGTAKSAICIDSIYYALYGKSFRKVVLGNMINSQTKKDMLVELEFSSGANQYRIVRGQKPSKFEIYINGVLKPQLANVKDYQAFLTNHILKMDEKTFRQLVIVGSGSYTPFMYLSAAERRVVIEDILRIDIFSAMQQVAKQYISEVSDSIKDIEYELKNLEMKISMQKKSDADKIRQYEELIVQERNEISRLEAEKIAKNSDLETSLSEIDFGKFKSVQAEISKLSNDISTLKQLRAKKSSQGDQIRKHREFFEKHNSCPTCLREMSREFASGKIAELDQKNARFLSEMKLFDDKIAELSETLSRCSEMFDSMSDRLSAVEKIKSDIQRLDANIKIYYQRIDDLEKKKIQEECSTDSEMNALVEDQKIMQTKYEDDSMKKLALSEISNLLKDDGVKKVIIRNYLPVINYLIKKYLDIIGFGIVFEFNENFEERIVSGGKEMYEYNNLSEGERLRLDCAIMFSFRELTKIQSSISTNILVLDEFDRGTLDEQGFGSVVDILRSCKGENIFVISHSPDQFSTIADCIVTVKKVHGFSEINV